VALEAALSWLNDKCKASLSALACPVLILGFQPGQKLGPLERDG